MSTINEPRIKRILENNIEKYVETALAAGLTKEEVKEVVTNAYRKIRYAWNNPRFNGLRDVDILKQEHQKILDRRKKNDTDGIQKGD